MTVVQKQIATLLLLVSLAGAQTAGPATLQDVRVSRAGQDVRIEVTLSAPVKASMITAVHPDRLVLELPNTTVSARQQHIPVYYNGVRVVRYALHQASPAVTRVVIELDQAQPYALQTNGSQLILTVSPELASRANSHRGAPAAAASGGFIGVFRRKQDTIPPEPVNENAQIPVAPPPGPALKFPQDQGASGTPASASSSHPSATHPSLGSLQQGTVFPNAGTPGAGNVPPVSGSAEGGFESAATTTASASAKTTPPSGTAFPATTVATAKSNTAKPASVLASPSPRILPGPLQQAARREVPRPLFRRVTPTSIPKTRRDRLRQRQRQRFRAPSRQRRRKPPALRFPVRHRPSPRPRLRRSRPK